MNKSDIVSKFVPGQLIDYNKINNIFAKFDDDIAELNAFGDADTSASLVLQDLTEKVSKIQDSINKLYGITNSLEMFISYPSDRINVINETFNKQEDKVAGDLQIDYTAGVATLPISDVKVLSTDAQFMLLPESKGTFTDTNYTKNILDSNISTIGEFVNSSPAKLKFYLKLSKPSIINRLTIVFAESTSALPVITKISVSQDGQEYKTISSNLQQQAYTVQYVLPRFAQYVEIEIDQADISADNLYRIPIGMIEVAAVVFNNAGIMQFNYTVPPTALYAIAVRLKENTGMLNLFNFKLEIQVDGQWRQIALLDSDKSPQILHYNAPWETENSIVNAPIDKIGLRVSISQADNISSIAALVKTNSIIVSDELIGVETGNLQLTRTPQGNVKLAIKTDVSAGDPTSRLLLGKTIQNKNNYTFPLPFNTNDYEEVYLNSIKISKRSSLQALYHSPSPCYFTDVENNKIHIFTGVDEVTSQIKPYQESWFNSSTSNSFTQQISSVDSDLPIELTLQPIRLTHNDNILVSEFPLISDDVSLLEVETLNGILSTATVVNFINANTRITRLSDIPVVLSDSDKPSIDGLYELKYIDGVQEFSEASDNAFSIDYSSGMLFLASEPSTTRSITFTKYNGRIINKGQYNINSDRTVITPLDSFNPDYAYFAYGPIGVSFTDFSILDRTITISKSKSQALEAQFGTGIIAYAYYSSILGNANNYAELLQYISPCIEDINIIYTKHE